MSNVVINVRTNPYYKGPKALDGNLYELRIKWNKYTEKWYMDIEGQNNDVDICGIALLPGKDLLAPFGYADILGELWLYDNSDAEDNPTYEEMGSRWTLEYIPLADL